MAELKFRKKSGIRGVLCGTLVDNEGRRIEVRHDSERYYCDYFAKTYTGATPEELATQIQNAHDPKRDWIDVICVTISRQKTIGCPATASMSVGFELAHLSKLADGSWVKAAWNPDSVFKDERKVSLPEDMTLPHRDTNGCHSGTVPMILPYSETTLADIKAFQVATTDLFEAKIEELLK